MKKTNLIIILLIAVGTLSVGTSYALTLLAGGDSVYVPQGHKIATESSASNYMTSPNGTTNQISIFSNSIKTLTANNGNVGIGISSPTTKLDVNGTLHATGLRLNQATKGIDYTLTATDDDVHANATNGVRTLTLPTSSGLAGHIFYLKKIDPTSNTVTIATTSSQKIDGASSLVLSKQYDFVVVVSDGKNWSILATNKFAGGITVGGNITSTASSGTFKITAPAGVAICIGTGC